MYPTHDELIEFIHLLGYPNYSDGFCFGLGAMAVSPPLTGSTEKANQRLQKIKASLDAYKEIQRNVEKEGAFYRTLNWYLDITYEIEDKIDILAYCQGVVFHFDADNYPDYFGPEEIIRQNLLLTNNIIQSIETEAATGLAFAGEIINHYTSTQKSSDVKNYTSILDKVLNTLKTTPSFSCLIHSKNHSIHIAYCAEMKQWCYFAINKKELRFHYTSDSNEISNLIEAEFFVDDCDSLVLTTEIYCLTAHKEEVIKFRNKWHSLLAHNYFRDIAQDKMKQDSLGNTWLCELAMHNDSVGTAYLIANQVNINLINSDGRTALHVACYMGHKNIVEALVDAGADVSRKTLVYEDTPMLIAIINKHYEVVKFLIEKDADLMVKDEDESTVLDYAILFKKTDIVECILTKLRSPEIILDKTLLKFFLEQQKNELDYIISSDTEKLFAAILDKHPITEDNKIYILQLYIIVRENEYRKNKTQYNSFFAHFFSPPGSNSQAKLNSAKALLNQEKDIEKCSAFQSGRLEKIAAFFLNPSHNSPENQHTNIKPAILTA